MRIHRHAGVAKDDGCHIPMPPIPRRDEGADPAIRNQMVTLRLSDHETDANHFREESGRLDLDRRGRLYDWRDDLRTLIIQSS